MSKHLMVGHELPPSETPEEKDKWRHECVHCGARGHDELGKPCVTLKWVTPDADQMIAYLARVSNSKATPDMPSAKLISYLLRNHHWSPFEMASMCLEINTTRDITNQIIRHRSFSFQEFSTRYADVEQLEEYRECRLQDDTNRQNSHQLSEEQKELAWWWDDVTRNIARGSSELYELARAKGIAKEVARTILPFGLLPSKIYMAGTIRSWLHYISERTKPGVQKEHRLVAEACFRILQQNLPETCEAYGAVGNG